MSTPFRTAVGAGGFWGTTSSRRYEIDELFRIDETSGRVDLRVSGAFTGVIVAGDRVWVWNSEDDQLQRLDPETGLILERGSHLGACRAIGTDDAIWVLTCSVDGAVELQRLDPATAAVQAKVTIPLEMLGSDGFMAVGQHDVWLSGESSDGETLYATPYDRDTLETGQTFAIPAGEALNVPNSNTAPRVLEAPDGSIWLTDYRAGQVVRVPPSAMTPE